MNFRVRNALVFLMTLAASGAAQAQDNVAVRIGDHSGYARVVFDWPAAVDYKVARKEQGALSITFARAANLSMVAPDSTKSALVKGLSFPDDKTAVIDIPADAQYRHFTIGSRIVIDVMGDTARAPEKVSTVKKDRPVAAAAAVEQKPPLKAGEVEKTVLEKAAQQIEPHVISLSVTEAVGMAVFERNGTLWVVLDRPDTLAPPEVTGSRENDFPSFRRHDLQGGVAFSMKLPADAGPHLYGEGGGLVWRIVVTPQPRAAEPAPMDRSFLAGDSIRGGTASWGFLGPQKVLELTDPEVGDVLKVVTVAASDQFAGARREFVDFDVLRSIVGLAVKPKADDLEVRISPAAVEVTRPGGLALSRTKDVNRSLMRQEIAEASIENVPADKESEEKKLRRIYDFDRWLMGGLQALDQNQRILMAGMAAKDKQGRVQDLLTLAKMNIANDRGQEAIGFLSYAEQEMPAIAQGPEYKALRGAANTLAGKYELAMQDFMSPVLAGYTELDYWRAYALACLEDWQQARKTVPGDYSLMVGYPRVLLEKIGLKLAEIALRSGDVPTAESVLAVLQKERNDLWPWTIAGMDYLKGEAHRQSGEMDSAKSAWQPLTKGADDLYRAKGGLALTMLELQTGDIKPAQAIDRLEGLRYAWRGDELEAQINFMLGRLYIEDRRFIKGFGILREAASLSPDSDVGHDITEYMAEKFENVLMEDKDLSPLDAVTIYEEFTELTPTGAEGNKLVQHLAERLVEADLLDRASNILQHQIDYRVEGPEKARVALRVAAIYLLNDAADKALAALDTAKSYYEQNKDDEASRASLRKIDMMRARALSKTNKTEEALVLLGRYDPAPDVNRLRADIAWQAGLWEDAAEALQDLIIDQALDLNRPLTQKQADLILNQAVAYNLSGNRVALANARKRYGDAMKKTARSKLFDVVTRPRQSTLLADRQTLEAIVAEVDIFKEFLEAYRDESAVE